MGPPLVALMMLLALAVSSTASADQRGVNLSWDDCGSHGLEDKSFACDTNEGAPFTMVASFTAPDFVTAAIEITVQINLIFGSSSVPSWWELRTQADQLHGCRDGELVWDQDSSTTSACGQPWAVAPQGGIGSYTLGAVFSQPYTAELLGVVAVASKDSAALIPGAEYYAMKFSITRSKTVGAGSCAGCDVTMCAALVRIKIYQTDGHPAGNPDIYDPPPGGRNTITWQGGGGANCSWVPVKRQTWGQIKALYH